MRGRVVIDPERPSSELLDQAAVILRESGVIAYPTETFYALGARAQDAAARARVSSLKGRDESKLLPLIAADLEQVLRIAEEPHAAVEKLASRFWPGPLTLVLPARPGLWGWPTLAVRVSSSAVAREIARRIGGPVTATSANRSGELPAETADAVEAEFGSKVDLILDGGRTPGGAPSTIVDLSEGEPVLVRPGAVDFEAILQALA